MSAQSAPSVATAQATPNNVIPFTKPRAISAHPTTFSTPAAAPSWGSAAVAAASPQKENPYASTFGSKAPLAPSSTDYIAQPIAPARFPNATPAPPLANLTPAAQGFGSVAPSSYSTAQNAFSAAAPMTVGNAALKVAPAPVAAPLPVPPAAIAVAAMATPGQGNAVPQAQMVTRPSATLITPPRAATNSNLAQPASKWNAFEKLGLGAPKLDHKKWSGRLVTAYRLLGFVILSIIVLVLVSYLVTTAFFYLSNSWVVPMALSPTDEKVVSLQSQLSERQTNRDRVAAELEQAERAITVQQEFQAEFAKAIKSDLEGRKAALTRMYELAAMASNTRQQIKRANSAYATASQKRMAEEWRAGLIDRESMLNGKFQVAQITSSNLSLAERQAEYETRAADLDTQTRALEALLAGNTATDGTLSYDVLKIKQEYEASRLETQRAIDTRNMLKGALEREDKLVESLKKSSYVKAMADGAHVAFVPYGNLEHAKKGTPLYGCALTMVFCKRVGTVIDVLPGEVQFKHPNRDKQLRGQMLELKLDNPADATDDVLFIGGRPLFI